MAGLTAVSTLVALVRNKLGAVMLGPQGIGIYSQGLTFLTFATTACTLGLGQGVVKHLAERDQGALGGITRSQIVRTALRLQIGIGLAAAVVVVALKHPLARLLFGDGAAWPYVVMLGAAIPLSLLLTNLGNFLQGFRRVRDFTLASALNALLGLAVFTVLLLRFGLQGVVLSLPLAAAGGCLVFWLVYRRPTPQEWSDPPAAGQAGSHVASLLLKFGAVVFLGGVLETLTALLLRTWIISSSGPELNGVYQAVVGLSGQYLGFFALFNNAYLYPRLSSLRGPAETTVEINNSLCSGLVLVVPLIAGIIIFRQELILALFTADFLPAADVLLWQALGDTLKVTSWFISASLLAQGRLRAFVGLSLVFSTVYLVSSFAFLERWGLTGLAAAHLLSYALHLGLVSAVQRRVIAFTLLPATLRVITPSAVMLMGVVCLPSDVPAHRATTLGFVVLWLLAVGGRRWLQAALARP
jgi:PST family polysaccharide transporter